MIDTTKRDNLFNEWYDDFIISSAEYISREDAHKIWNVAYRLGGEQPWWTINKEQLKVLMKG